MPQPGPLTGVLVVDLSRVLAGPFATMILADLGARVVKVERPGTGDDSRSYGPFVGEHSLYFARVNRGKESVALDLRAPADREVLDALLSRADVLVENFRPGVMARLGLGADVLAERYPRLVYASVSGFGQTGPWRSRPAYDSVVQAAAGVLSVTGRPDDEPTKPGLPVSDLAGGLYAAIGVLAALRARDAPDPGAGRRGRGTRVDVAMYDATLSLLEGAAQQYLAAGAVPPRIGNAHYSIAPFDTFRCADRPIVICAANDALFARLAAVLERPDLAADPAYADNRGRHAHREQLKAAIEAALAGRRAEDWLERLAAAGVPAGPLADVGEALTSEQVVARNMVVRAGNLPMPGNPVKADGWPDPPERVAAPALDEHGAMVRRELGLPPTSGPDAAEHG